jgi:hypothetical protein
MRPLLLYGFFPRLLFPFTPLSLFFFFCSVHACMLTSLVHFLAHQPQREWESVQDMHVMPRHGCMLPRLMLGWWRGGVEPGRIKERRRVKGYVSPSPSPSSRARTLPTGRQACLAWPRRSLEARGMRLFSCRQARHLRDMQCKCNSASGWSCRKPAGCGCTRASLGPGGGSLISTAQPFLFFFFLMCFPPLLSASQPPACYASSLTGVAHSA